MKAINVILALLVSAALAFGVAEIGLRLLGFAPPAINTEGDAALGWCKQANSTIQMESGEYDVTIQTDAHGLRDDYTSDEVPAKPEGTTRMLFLGDSFTLGYTVAREDLFVDLLEGAWQDEGRKVEIVNAGTQAYSTDQALVWLGEHGAKFDPDVVVLFPYENDIWWNAQGQYLGQDKPLFDENGVRANGELAIPAPRGWFASTAVGNLLRKKAGMPNLKVDGLGKTKKISVEMSSRLKSPPQTTLTAEARTKVLFQKLADASAALGARFAVCPLPSREAVTPPEDLPAALDPARPYELFIDAANAVGAVTSLPLEPLKTAAAKGWTPYYKRDFHLNAQGNLVLAQALKTDLEAAGLVPAKAAAGGAPEKAPVMLMDTANPAAPPVAPKKMPKWPFFFVGLWAALGTLYANTYSDESAGVGFLKVGGLLAVVFATAIGVTSLIAILPPLYGKLLLVGLVIAILTFVLYKLGDRVGTIAELMKAFTLRGHWYLMPLLTVLLTVGSLLVVAASSPLIAPFIYTLF
jgi:lysophospholipase L1-like esterase